MTAPGTSLPTQPVVGRCPMGCAGHTLRVDSWGQVACTARTCTRPTAAAELLALGDGGHVLQTFAPGNAAVLSHPIHERISAQVATCPLNARRTELDLNLRPGRYQVLSDQHGFLHYARIPA